MGSHETFRAPVWAWVFAAAAVAVVLLSAGGSPDADAVGLDTTAGPDRADLEATLDWRAHELARVEASGCVADDTCADTLAHSGPVDPGDVAAERAALARLDAALDAGEVTDRLAGAIWQPAVTGRWMPDL